jgi:hypothetical protein
MKSLQTTLGSIILILISTLSVAHAEQEVLAFDCKAGISDVLNFSAQVSENEIEIAFAKKQLSKWRDLAGKSMKLIYNQNRGNFEWKYNTAKLAVGEQFHDYIYVELGYRRSEIVHQQLIGNFALSPRSSILGPIYMNAMNLECQ